MLDHPKVAYSLIDGHRRPRILNRIWNEIVPRARRLVILYIILTLIGFILLLSFFSSGINSDGKQKPELSFNQAGVGDIQNKTKFEVIARHGNTINLAKIEPIKVISFDDLIKEVDFNINGNDVIVFLHIQKTGGTTFGKHLVKDLNLEKPCECEESKRKCRCTRPNSTSEDEPWLVSRFSTGWKCGLHADWTEMTECLNKEISQTHTISSIPYKPRYLYVSFLRNPIRRFVSEFLHVQRGATWKSSRHLCAGRPPSYNQLPPCYESRDWRDVTLEEFMSCRSNLGINRQTRMLANLTLVGCYDNSKMSTEERDRIMLESAKQNLQSMAFFGLCEYQRASQIIFEETFHMKFNRNFTQSNETRTSQALSDLSPHTIDVIKKLNHLDILLYEFATKLFSSRYKALQPGLMNDSSIEGSITLP